VTENLTSEAETGRRLISALGGQHFTEVFLSLLDEVCRDTGHGSLKLVIHAGRGVLVKVEKSYKPLKDKKNGKATRNNLQESERSLGSADLLEG
jgi:hypothetical protein